MKFSEYDYKRPDYDAVKADYDKWTTQLKQATDLATAREAVEAVIALEVAVQTPAELCNIRHSINTFDEFYEKEIDYWNEYAPLYNSLNTGYLKVLLASPFKNDLSDLLPDTYFAMAENQLKTFSDDAIELFQRENTLRVEYDRLIASAQIDFQGEVYNLSQFGPMMQSTDRDMRKAASEAYYGYFAEHEADFDRIYDDMVKVRHQIATTLGFKDYVEFAYHNMNRLDYNREDVQVYREEIRKHVVPVVEELRRRQAARIGIDDMKYYDLGLEFLDGNATPQGTPDFILEQGVKMYHEMSKETGEFIDFMVEHDLLDLVAKKGKDSGGYCTYIPGFHSPFIFSNFNGTSGDVDVLTHEAGHAFQVFRSRWIKSPAVIWPTYESCEIHSMSMEFFAWPWMANFFNEQVDKYKFSHLSGTLLFLPYGVLVDHFQHEVYEHPEWTPAQRKAAWRRLEKLYLPSKDYGDNEALERGIFWFRQGHIFDSPFYYIDYTLAQVCALQFWKRAIIDHDAAAWPDYLRICDLGGTKSFLQIVDAAGLQSPFKPGALESTVAAAKAYLDNVDDTAL